MSCRLFFRTRLYDVAAAFLLLQSLHGALAYVRFSSCNQVQNTIYGNTLVHTKSRAHSALTPLKMSLAAEPPNDIIKYKFRVGNGLSPSAPGDVPSKLGVLLLNLGGPETGEDVEPFLYNLFADPDIIRLPSLLSWLQQPLARFISMRRAPKSRAAYDSIGGGSPIVKYTKAQAKELESRLDSLGFNDAKCYIAMRYWHPFTEEALEEIKADGVNTLVVLPLYPQFSISTSGSSLRALQKMFYEEGSYWLSDRIRHTVIPSWYARPGYINAISRLIMKEVDKYTPEEREEGIHVLFSAHGVPQSYIKVGDPYQRHIEECVQKIGATLPIDIEANVHLAYQSRVGPVEWLRPYTDEKLEELGQGPLKVKNLVVVPISFVSEHIETLEEIDIEYRELAEEKGITNWRRVPALNTDKNFMEALTALVVDSLQRPSITISEAVAGNNCDMDGETLESRLGFNCSGSKRGALASLTAEINLASSSSSSFSSSSSSSYGSGGMGGFDGTGMGSNKAADKEGGILDGKLAVFGVASTLLVELFSGQSVMHLMGFM